MPNSVSLPFWVPWFAHTQGNAAPGLAMLGHPTAYNGVLNQCTTLCCSRRFLDGFTSPEIWVPRGGIHAFDFLEKQGVASRFCHQYHKAIIKQMLDEGYYVYFSGVDDFYMPGKSWYGIRHMSHDGVLCGYDDADQTYLVAAYDINWIYNLFRVPQECFSQGLNSCIEKQQFGAITAYKLKNNITVPLDEKKILSYLKDYVKNTVDKYPLDQQGGVEGIAVQDFLALYLDKIKDGSIPADKMDWRALRPVWEHKRCMLDRIKAIEEKRNWKPDLSTKYTPLVDDANRVRMMYAMYHKTQKESLLDKMKNGILAFKDREYEILTELIQKMEEIST